MRSDVASWFGWPFARLWNRSAPNSATPVAIVGPDLSQPQPSNIDVAVTPRGRGALMAHVPDETTVGGNKRGLGATDFQKARTAASQVASGTNSVIVGGQNNSANGLNAAVVAGSDSSAGGEASFVGGGNTNSASAQWASIVSGFYCSATGQGAFVGNGSFCTASNSYASVVGGASNTAGGSASFVGGGESNTANGAHSTIPGGRNGTTRQLAGRLSYSAGQFTAQGDAQYGLGVFRVETTGATTTTLTATGAALGNLLTAHLPNNGLYAFRARVVCIQSAGTAGAALDSKAWDIVGAIKRGASAAATSLLGTPTITVLGADANLGTDNSTGAVVAVVANTTWGSLAINVTGEANKTLRWVATIETTEVAF